MKTTFVSVIYDRKKRVKATGEGKVEFYIHFSRYEKKYVTIKTCNPIEWRKYQKSDELRLELATYHQVAQKMYDSGEEMTVANLNYHLGIEPSKPKRKELDKKLTSKDGFITFMNEEIDKEKLASGTKARKKVAINAVIRFGRLSSFSQLTPENVKAFDDFLQNECARTLVTINNYHRADVHPTGLPAWLHPERPLQASPLQVLERHVQGTPSADRRRTHPIKEPR